MSSFPRHHAFVAALGSAALLVLTVAPSARAQFAPPAPVNLGVGLGGANITGIVGGDLNHDRRSDLVAVDDVPNGLVGFGIKQAGPVYLVGTIGPTGSTTGATLPTLGDFNLDQVLDLVYAGTSAGQPAVFVAQGTIVGGTFNFILNVAGPFLVAPAGNTIDGVSISDYTGDGNQDIVVSVIGPNRRVTIIPGVGGLTFGPLITVTTSIGPEDVDICVDANNDGKKDFTICGTDQATGAAAVEVFAGGGSATPSLLAHVPLPSGTVPIDVHWFDCDQDRRYDLAVATGGSLRGVFVLKNVGSPLFFTPLAMQFFPTTDNPNSLQRLDFDFDGQEDLTVFSTGTTGGSLKPTSFQVFKVVNCNLVSAGSIAAGTFDTATVQLDVGKLHAVDDAEFDGKLDLLSAFNDSASNDLALVFQNIAQPSLTVTPERPLLGDTIPFVFSLNVPGFGGRPFVIFFSINGTLPGTPVSPFVTLPLNLPVLAMMLSGSLGPTGTQTITTGPISIPAAPVAFSLQLDCAALIQGPTPGSIGTATNPAIITMP